MKLENVTGKVISYDASTGWARVRITGGKIVRMFTGAFCSGRPARHPQAGDTVVATLGSDDTIIIARLVNTLPPPP